jgi:hypothetical protein
MERGRQLATELRNVKYVDVSAMDDCNVEDAFLLLAEEMQAKGEFSYPSDPAIRRLAHKRAKGRKGRCRDAP